jgi:E3 ubiquitin-protein ligase NRDP1
MNPDPNRGYPKERFPELKGDSFDCGICYLVCKDPKECMKCGSMYCAYCIDDWTTKKNECPIGCTDARGSIRPVSGALSKLYRNLDIKCKYPSCGKVVKLCELTQHEEGCQRPKCEFHSVCGNYVKNEFQKEGVCDPVCALMKKIKISNGNWKTVYEEIKNLSKVKPSLPIDNGGDKVTVSKWDTTKIGHGIEVSADKKTVYLKENAYMFRSAISDTPMMGGIHYWEIIADPRTENELKIGVALKKEFNYDTAFSDYEFGYSYYGLGQLRHNSNSIGAPYGKKFKKEGVLGCCLDMNKGTLSFSLNGEYWGEAYKGDALKKGPAYVAVSLLHQAGCKLESGKPVPSYFLKN